MVFKTMLILHSLTQCCVVNSSSRIFLSNFAIHFYVYRSAYIIFVLHFANKGMHDFSVKKVVMLIFFLFEHFSHRVTRIDVQWVHKNKVHGAIVFVLVAPF